MMLYTLNGAFYLETGKNVDWEKNTYDLIKQSILNFLILCDNCKKFILKCVLLIKYLLNYRKD